MKSKLNHGNISKCMWDQTAFVWFNVYQNDPSKTSKIRFQGPKDGATKDNENLRRMDQYIPVINRGKLPFQLVQDFFHQPYLKITCLMICPWNEQQFNININIVKIYMGNVISKICFFAMYIYLPIVNLRFETNIHPSILSMNGIFAIWIRYELCMDHLCSFAIGY